MVPYVVSITVCLEGKYNILYLVLGDYSCIHYNTEFSVKQFGCLRNCMHVFFEDKQTCSS